MILKNKLNIKNEMELARIEEKLSKTRAKELFDSEMLDTFNAGDFQSLCLIHKHLFSDIYDFAGKIRDVNISKGNFRFAPITYLNDAIKNIENLPQNTFDAIVEKYIEMNVAHPFREGNGRSMRIWLDIIFKKELKRVVDWSKIDKEDYLLAMERSPIKDTEIKLLLKDALVDDINNRKVYLKGIDTSYAYEGYMVYKSEDLE